MLGIRITDVVQLLITASSRGRCDWDIGAACWRQEEVEEIKGQRIGWIYLYMHDEVKKSVEELVSEVFTFSVNEGSTRRRAHTCNGRIGFDNLAEVFKEGREEQ